MLHRLRGSLVKPLILVDGLLAGNFVAEGAGFLWDGGSPTSNNLSDAANWSPDGAPPNDGTADLQFGGAIRLTPIADTAYSLHSLTIHSGAGAFNLSGGTLTLGAGGLTNATTSGGGKTINNRQPLGQRGPDRAHERRFAKRRGPSAHCRRRVSHL